MEILKDLGIEYIVNLQEEKELDKNYKKLTQDFQIINLEVVDRKIAEDEKIIELLDTLYELVKEKHKIYIHCLGGKGRTGVIVALLLSKYYGYGATNSLKKTQELFDTRKDKGDKCPKSPQTKEQKDQVKRLLSTERTYTRETEHAFLFTGFGKDYSLYPIFSNYYMKDFTDKDDDIWHSNEQFYHAMKAIEFEDEEMYNKIRKTDNPQSSKNYGRKVKNFNEKRWAKVSYEYMLEGLRYKFQDKKLKKYLLNTGDKLIIESSPWDKVWGTGLEIGHYDAMDPEMFKGKNLLGKALMEIRKEISNK